MILSSNAWQLDALGLNITERPDTVLLTILSSTCTFSINTDGRNTERAHLGQHRVWASADTERQTIREEVLKEKGEEK